MTSAKGKGVSPRLPYEPPVLDPAIEEALTDFATRRKAEIAREPADF